MDTGQPPSPSSQPGPAASGARSSHGSSPTHGAALTACAHSPARSQPSYLNTQIPSKGWHLPAQGKHGGQAGADGGGIETTGSGEPSARCRGSSEPGRFISPAQPSPPKPLPPSIPLPWSHLSPCAPKEVPGLCTSLGETPGRCSRALASTAPKKQGNPFPLLIPAKNEAKNPLQAPGASSPVTYRKAG